MWALHGDRQKGSTERGDDFKATDILILIAPFEIAYINLNRINTYVRRLSYRIFWSEKTNDGEIRFPFPLHHTISPMGIFHWTLRNVLLYDWCFFIRPIAFQHAECYHSTPPALSPPPSPSLSHSHTHKPMPNRRTTTTRTLTIHRPTFR